MLPRYGTTGNILFKTGVARLEKHLDLTISQQNNTGLKQCCAPVVSNVIRVPGREGGGW